MVPELMDTLCKIQAVQICRLCCIGDWWCQVAALSVCVVGGRYCLKVFTACTMTSDEGEIIVGAQQ